MTSAAVANIATIKKKTNQKFGGLAAGLLLRDSPLPELPPRGLPLRKLLFRLLCRLLLDGFVSLVGPVIVPLRWCALSARSFFVFSSRSTEERTTCRFLHSF